MNIPDDLMYTKEHEWVKIEGNIATVGITEYAAGQLGDIVYAELPAEGEAVTKDETFGALESVKAVSDCYAPMSGKVIEINDVLSENPETLNEDPYGDGWMVRIEMESSSDTKELMDHKAYATFVAEESK